MAPVLSVEQLGHTLVQVKILRLQAHGRGRCDDLLSFVDLIFQRGLYLLSYHQCTLYVDEFLRYNAILDWEIFKLLRLKCRLRWLNRVDKHSLVGLDVILHWSTDLLLHDELGKRRELKLLRFELLFLLHVMFILKLIEIECI